MKQASINTNRFELISTIALSILFALTMLYVSQNIIGLLSDGLLLERLSFLAITFLLVILILNKYKYKNISIVPSIYLIVFFLIVPPIGIQGYKIFIKLYGCYMGNKLHFEFPIYLWYLGTMCFSFGLFTGHMIKRKNNYVLLEWKLDKVKRLLIIFSAISSVFTILAIMKIGYIPLLKSNIDYERFSYLTLVGDYAIKFSRLWLLVFIFAAVLYFAENRSKRYLIIMTISALLSIVYTQRQYLFFLLCFFFLLFTKNNKKIKLSLISIIAVALLLIFFAIGTIRGDVAEKRGISFIERVNMSTFGEWREYSYLVNIFNKSENYLKEEILIGIFAPILPKQIWTAIGYDKEQLLSYNASNYFGRYFNHYAGIRIGMIGESYVAYGLSGTIIALYGLGLLFGYLESIFLALKNDDARLSLIGFLISILMFLPLLTPVVFTTHIVFFGFFILISIFYAVEKKNRTVIS